MALRTPAPRPLPLPRDCVMAADLDDAEAAGFRDGSAAPGCHPGFDRSWGETSSILGCAYRRGWDLAIRAGQSWARSVGVG